MKRAWCCRDLEGEFTEEVYLFVGDKPPIMDDDGEWTDPDDSTWIGEFDLRATYGVGFVESLPDIANGEMTEIRIKYTAEKCE